jgi:hypothetical protein
MRLPRNKQIVFVDGGVAQFRDGVFYTGMEDPRYTRPIQWEVKWWLPIFGTLQFAADLLADAAQKELLRTGRLL